MPFEGDYMYPDLNPIAVLFTLSIIFLAIWVRYVGDRSIYNFKKVNRTMMFCQPYQFHLARKIAVPGSYPRAVVSTHTIEVTTDDPFRTREVILKDFPGWYCVAFDSSIDREYNETANKVKRKIQYPRPFRPESDPGHED